MNRVPGWVSFGVVTAGLVTACGGRAADEAAAGIGVGGSTHSDSGAAAGGVTTVPPTSIGGTLNTSTPIAAAGGSAAVTPLGSGGAVACSGIPVDELAVTSNSCNGTQLEAEPLPIDMVVLLDRSAANATVVGPGAETRWNRLAATMQAVANSPAAADLGMSLTLYGRNSTSLATECSASTYAVADVGLSLVDASGAALVDAVKNTSPAGLSPVRPALEGALAYARSQQAQDPMREKAVVIIGNGLPSECDVGMAAVTNVIQRGLSGTVPIRTFVIGLGSETELLANEPVFASYAAAGGTNRPYLVADTTSSDAFVNQLAAVLFAIAGSSTNCEYALTPPSADWIIDPELVTISYRPNIGVEQEFPRLAVSERCSRSPNGGWYFDDPAMPTKFTLCPCSCALVDKGSVLVTFGCRRVWITE